MDYAAHQSSYKDDREPVTVEMAGSSCHRLTENGWHSTDWLSPKWHVISSSSPQSCSWLAGSGVLPGASALLPSPNQQNDVDCSSSELNVLYTVSKKPDRYD